MKDVQNTTSVNLSTLVTRLREGRYAIPDFQREFEWQPGDIRDLMNSIFRDYYIGSLLLWKGKKINFEALSCESIYGYLGVSEKSNIVLDGQQRLTAMYYAFIAPEVPLPKRSNRYLFFILVDQFMEENYDESFVYDWTKRGVNVLNDERRQFKSHWFPLSLIGKEDFSLPNWLQSYTTYWRQCEESALASGDEIDAESARRHAANAEQFGKIVSDITSQYQVAYIELEEDLGLEKVCDIFTSINSRGIRLDIFDLVNALLRPKDIHLKKMWREDGKRFDNVDAERMNVYVLQVMSILLQNYCSPKYLYYLLPGQTKHVRNSDGSIRTVTLIKDSGEFCRRWKNSIDAIDESVKQLWHPQEFGVISSQYLPYTSILPAFASLQTVAKELSETRRISAQCKIRHWYWASVFTNRYAGSVASTIARDFLDVKEWFNDNNAEPPLIAEFRDKMSSNSIDLRREVKKGTSIYNGIFNLLVVRGARDWISDTVPSSDNLDDHHIVPRSKGECVAHGDSIDTILNRTPLTLDTNRNVIRDRLPNEYIPELIEKNSEDKIREIFETHFISQLAFDILLRKPFGRDDYEEFLDERRKLLGKAMAATLKPQILASALAQ